MPDIVFHGAEFFSRREASGYHFLPFRFMDFDNRKILVNEVGEHCFLNQATFDTFVSKRLQPTDPAYLDLKSHHFLWDTGSKVPTHLLALKYRTKRGFLAGFTRLHIFVVTLRCDHSCQYCQVSRVSPDKQKYDMSKESADKSLDLVFRSPSEDIKIEFQGGEPLLNFDLIKYIFEQAQARNAQHGKRIEFVVTSNLAFISDEILDFLKQNNIVISTSLDGPAFIHNANRPRPGNDSHDRALSGIRRVRAALGHDRVSAVMTTTRLSLDYPVEIVDEYVGHEFNSIFLRPISPYGFAIRTRPKTGYELELFITFYKKALEHIIELNRQGVWIVESYAQLLLKKILTPFPTGYVDLQSPAGAGIGVAVYNYDGDVYPTDEARMLLEMGDRTFRLGNVHTNSYEEIFGGEILRTLVAASCVESLPGCADCAFQTYCGCDPVENYATQGNIFGHRPTSNFHKRNLEIIKHLLRLFHGEDTFVRRLFLSWVQNAPITELIPTVSGN
jgi:uncharacterized protein